jgi:acetyl esterase/lipase
MRKFLDIPFGKVAERTLYLDALVPEGVSGPNPIVLWLHGGGWYEGNKRNIIDQGALEFLVENGFVVASAEYKLSPEAKFPAQIFDVKAAIRWLRAKPEVLGGDPDRIAIAGFSAGAQLSALAGTTADRPEFEGEGGSPGHSTRVSAVIAIAAPTDFMRNPAAHDPSLRPITVGGTTHEQYLLGGPISEKRELAHMANPGAFIGPNTPPFLIIHGTRDEIVDVSQADYCSTLFRTRMSRLPISGSKEVITVVGQLGNLTPPSRFQLR